MRIAVDATAARSLGHGIGTYVSGLLAELPAVESDNHYIAYLSGRASDRLAVCSQFSKRVSFRTVTAFRPLRVIWEQMVLPLEVSRLHCNVLWGCHNTLPAFKTTPQVVTVHDIGMLVLPQYYPRSKVAYFRHAILAAVRQADIVVSVSEFTSLELQSRLGVPRKKIRVVQNGVDAQFRPVNEPEKLERVRHALRLPDKFILALGVPEPKKNLECLLRAFATLRAQHAIEHKLVIGGARRLGWKNQRFYELAQSLGDSVILLDFVVQEDLPTLYTLADLFVFPSLYEGFGLPPLEAMSCGTPVVSSHSASLPEVLGDAAVLVDPKDERQLAEAILRVLSDSDLSSRLKERGRVNANRFSWQRAAQSLTAVFKEVAA
ncbi:MAG: glycosyltransferase family 1 protein [candidate division WOR-3 bacterium]